ncbi:MAG TPA: amino acid adenylation domain-containing protein [Jatrophihabitans sp.]|nr:amino acid adenylation domain-containing protein [Jatrophihabitans sp.]
MGLTGRPRTIPEEVARQVAARPGATAIVEGADRLDYRQLAAESDAVAARLVAAGVRPGERVGVLLPRSAELIVVLLGVLKAGAAYAGLDPKWPAARLGSVLDQLQPAAVVARQPTVPAGAPRLPPSGPAPAGVRLPRVRPDDPATVFFTSGTTGVPKGVLSPHAATTRLFGDGGLAGFVPGAVVPQVAPSSWDAFSLEVWGALCAGGTVAVFGDDHFMPFDLAELTRQHGVTCAWLTASLFNLFVDTQPGCFEGLRQLYIGGERLSVPHVARFRQRHPRIRLFNGYGPVESCVFVSVHEIGPADLGPGGVPVGTAVPGTELFVLDGDRLCEPGEIGEIVAAGSGLALGYLGDPQLTERKFPTRVIRDRRLRVYRTGDRGCVDGRGVLHFRGRSDRQVKVRGHRIELAEIERAAGAALPIEQCAVVPVPDATGAVDRLVLAFTDGTPAGPLPAARVAELRQLLAARLPDYAVPGGYCRVASFPTTANGKLDREALRRLVTG